MCGDWNEKEWISPKIKSIANIWDDPNNSHNHNVMEVDDSMVHVPIGELLYLYSNKFN